MDLLGWVAGAVAFLTTFVIVGRDVVLLRAPEVYAAVVRAALRDGVITPRERSILGAIRRALGLPVIEAWAIEQMERAIRSLAA